MRRAGGGGNGGPLDTTLRDSLPHNLSWRLGPAGGPPGALPGEDKVPKPGSQALLIGKEAAGPRGARGRGRGALGALPGGQTSPSIAERSVPNPSGEWRAQLLAPAGTTGCRPSSGTRFSAERSPGEGANFSPRLAPPGPLAPAQGMALAAAVGTQGIASHDLAASSSRGRPWRWWPAFGPVAWGRGAAAPRGRGLSGLGPGGSAGGGREPSSLPSAKKRGKARRGGTRAAFKVSGNPSAAGGGWRGCEQLSWAPASPHLSLPPPPPEILTPASTLLWPAP